MSGCMAAKNWLKIDTSVLEGDVWGEKFSKVEAYIYLVKTARWQKNETEKNGITFGTGQLVTSYRELADIWGWKRSSVERFCKSLIERKIIEIESDKKSKTYSCVTIVNMKCETTIEHKWDTSGTPNGTPGGTQKQPCTTDLRGVDGTPGGTHFGTQAGHPSRAQVVTESDLFNLDNIDKNKVEVESPYNPPREKPKGYENFDFSFVDDKFYDVFTQWLDYKRSGGNKRFIYKSQKSLETCYNGIVKTSKGNPDAAIEILIHCITSSYQGFFAPRDFWESYSKTINIDYPQDFEDDFSLYGRKGSKVDGYNRWKNLTEEDKVKMRRHIPYYLQSNDRQFLKDFDGYINQRLFESPVYHKSNLLFDPQTIENNEAGVYDPSGWLNYDESFNAWRYFGREPKYDLRDGYTDENRPDGARVVTQATVYLWSAANKNWSLTK